MNENGKFLPVGTVVRLKDAKKDIMITGFCPVSNDSHLTFDYSACFYPEGIVTSDVNFLFNHEQIETILFKGYINDEEINFKQKLNEFVQNAEANGVNFDPANEDYLKSNTVTQPQMFNNNNN